MLRHVFLFAATALCAIAQIPEIPGYSRTTLSYNLPLPVKVVGAGTSEQDVPAILFIPSENASLIEGSRPAASIPGLPANLAGYRLVVLVDAVRSPLSLRNGRAGEVDVPVFAYESVDGAGDLTALRLALSTGTRTNVASSASPAYSPPARTATIAAARMPSFGAQHPSLETTVPTTPTIEVAVAGESEPAIVQLKLKASSSKSVLRSSVATEAAVPNNQTVLYPTTPASVAVPEIPVTWDEALAADFKFSDKITVGQVIVDERQSLRTRLPVRVDFPQRPLSEVLLSLATEAGLDFSIGSLPADVPVTARFSAPPFAALEQIAKQFGVGLYHEKDDPLWVIRRIDPETLIAHTYKLEHLTLGTSSGAAGDKTFGSGFSEQGSSNSNSGSGSRSGSGTGGATGMGSSSGVSSSSAGTNSGASGGINLPHQTDTFGERFSTPSDVLFTIQSILGVIDIAPVVSELQAPGSEADPTTAHLSTRPSAQVGDKVKGIVSYNSDSGTLFVVGTEKQQSWVAEYLKVVDQPQVIIAVDALFVESNSNPTSKMGVDWSSTFVDWNVSGPTSLSWGTPGHVALPSGVAITSDGFAASLSAYITATKSRVARYPRAVTSNNREVRIATTSNIPIISNASTIGSAVGTNGDGTVQTSYSAGTQEIGTIITILPSKVGADKVHLKISIEISSGGGDSGGEKLSGRITTTSTTYEGEVVVPAGRTLAIGGLERIAESSGIGRVPILSKIPVFGFLFKKQDVDFSNTNITLFITPRFIDGYALPDASSRANGGPERAVANSVALERHASDEAAKKDWQ